MNVSINDISNTIVNVMREYTEKVTEGIEQELDDRSKSLTKEIKSDSPSDKGDYKKGWTRKKIVNGGNVQYVTYNKKRGSLVHLLEHGHAKRGGGRVVGKAHVRPATERETALLEQNVKSIIQNGG